jgi:hypothetical protein
MHVIHSPLCTAHYGSVKDSINQRAYRRAPSNTHHERVTPSGHRKMPPLEYNINPKALAASWRRIETPSVILTRATLLPTLLFKEDGTVRTAAFIIKID